MGRTNVSKILNARHAEIVNNLIIFMNYVNLREYIKIIKWLGG